MTGELASLSDGISDDGLPDRYVDRPPVTKADLEESLSVAIARIDDNLEAFSDRFPTASSDDLTYPSTDNMTGWTAAFWTGQCWLAYEATGNDRFRDAAETQLKTFVRRLEEGDVKTHDLGFLYTLSAVAGHRLTGRESYRKAAIRAADLLADRFWEAPGLIQAWEDTESPDENPWSHGRMIVDTMMNLPLLFWVSEATGDETYATIAETHARTTAKFLVRSDGSTAHTFQCDVTSGEPRGVATHQGYSDDSCWARGQAWSIYGYAIAAEYTGTSTYLDLSTKIANYYLHRVEADHVPRWDFDAPTDDHVRDSSAASIAACGCAQLASELPLADDRIDGYRNAALSMLGSLSETYVTDSSVSNGLLSDAAYNRREGDFDECCIWGDYFYVEGLVRATNLWSRYW